MCTTHVMFCEPAQPPSVLFFTVSSVLHALSFVFVSSIHFSTFLLLSLTYLFYLSHGMIDDWDGGPKLYLLVSFSFFMTGVHGSKTPLFLWPKPISPCFFVFFTLFLSPFK